MKILGLTGKTGAGKSTITKILSENDCFVIDADIVAREILCDSDEVLKKLSETFGNEILDQNGELIRSELAKRAFETQTQTDKLNAITHPAIVQNIKLKLDKALQLGYAACVIDAAVLLECELKDICDFIIVVHSPELVRLERIMLRDKISKDQALLRINAQKSDEYYMENADILVNNFEPHKLDEQIKKILKVIT
ncbi:MAG: dephospho-CoA kinase [Clostridia bacterium]